MFSILDYDFDAWTQVMVETIASFTSDVEVLQFIALGFSQFLYCFIAFVGFICSILVLGLAVWLFKWVYKYLNIFFN